MPETEEHRPFQIRETRGPWPRKHIAGCPFCDSTITLYEHRSTGIGKRTCRCGAVLRPDGVARKALAVEL